LDEKQIKDIYETGKFTRKVIQENDELATAKSFDEAKAAVDAKDSEAESRFEHHDESEEDNHSEADHSSDSSNDDNADENK